MAIPHAISVILSIVLLCIGGMIHEIMAAEASNGKLIEIDLDIFNGQDGAEVPDDKEVTIGAFTVANINNTDDNSDAKGAPGIDRDQATVPGEVDLMKMIIRKPSRNIAGKKLILTKERGSAKVYMASTKGTEVALPHEYTYEEIGEGVTLWVEATAASVTVRDIEFKIVYSTADDNVKATGIWALRSSFKNKTTDLFWPEAKSPPKGIFDQRGKFGLVPPGPFPVGITNGMGMSFDIEPIGVSSEPGVKIDISRQVEFRAWFVDGGEISHTEGLKWPSGDISNDDALDDDEGVAPPNSTVYVVDFPGLKEARAVSEQFILRINANEFVRIRVDDKRPTGNVLSGSRGSNKQPWFSKLGFKKLPPPNNLLYVRDPTLANVIDLGQTTIGVFPLENP